MNQSEDLFDETQKLPQSLAAFDTRILRTVLGHFRFAKSYLGSLPKETLVELVCDCFKIHASDNVHEKLNVRTMGELYELAKQRDQLVVRRAEGRKQGRQGSAGRKAERGRTREL